eukprot:gi/632985743/ref/XP_007909854.1/ PREDICTED: tensin-like [Callorhinchus milii]
MASSWSYATPDRELTSRAIDWEPRERWDGEDDGRELGRVSCRSFSVDHVMERNYDFDLTYITERIISVFFPPVLEEQRYRSNLKEVSHMLKSKHGDSYLVSFLCWRPNENNIINNLQSMIRLRDASRRGPD